MQFWQIGDGLPTALGETFSQTQEINYKGCHWKLARCKLGDEYYNVYDNISGALLT